MVTIEVETRVKWITEVDDLLVHTPTPKSAQLLIRLLGKITNDG
jgi:hypothetical protein